jgi:hypothetical protein
LFDRCGNKSTLPSNRHGPVQKLILNEERHMAVQAQYSVG